jgi:nucleotide-binding universal stress UspA family protein
LLLDVGYIAYWLQIRKGRIVMLTDRKLLYPQAIHLAVDGSEHSLAAAQLLRDLPLPAGSKIAVLGVLNPRNPPGRAALLASIEDVKAILQGSAAELSDGLLHGHPAQALIEFADEHHPDLMVVGAQGLSHTLGILLGGVAQQVVEHARWPILVTRAPYRKLRRILVTNDGSAGGEATIQYMTHFPLPGEAQIEVMHVLSPLPTAEIMVPAGHIFSPRPASVTPEQIEQMVTQEAEDEEHQAQAMLAETVQIFKSTDLKAEHFLTRGDPAEEILCRVNEQEVDLVVAGSRGMSAVKGWLLGSVSRKLIYHSPCPVLIARGHEESTA